MLTKDHLNATNTNSIELTQLMAVVRELAPESTLHTDPSEATLLFLESLSKSSAVAVNTKLASSHLKVL